MASRGRPRGKKAAARPEMVVVSFSPLGLTACYSKLFEYAQIKAGKSRPFVISSREDAAAVKFAERHLADGVLVAAAGDGNDIPKLQAVLDKANVGIKLQPQSHDALIGVSSVAYRFEWDMAMKLAEERADGSFRLKGANNTCFLGRVFAKAGQFDALVAYVDPEASCDMTVAMIGMPDQLPDSLHGLKNADQVRIALDGLYKSRIVRARPVKNPPPLGLATLYDVDGMTAYELPDFVGKPLAGGRTIDEARQVCRLFMNKDGGGVMAGTVMMSKGLVMSEKTPVDIDFRKFRNGYLAIIEMSHSNKPKDNVALVIGWVNPPEAIRAVL